MARPVIVSRCATAAFLSAIALFANIFSASVRAAEEPTPAAKDPPKQAAVSPPATSAASLAEEKIFKVLDEKVHWDFVDKPLMIVMKEVAHQHKVPIAFDLVSVDKANFFPEWPITINVSGISFRSALRLMLRDLQLTYIIHNETLLITSPEKAERMLIVRVYPVTDLVPLTKNNPTTGQASNDYDYDSLIELIQSTIQPTTWDDVGGPGNIREFRGNLVIAQTDFIHEEIIHLLSGLRKLPPFDIQQAALQKVPRPKILSAFYQRWSDKQLAEALKQKTTLEFVDEPLEKALQYISKKHHIPITLDRDALEEAGISHDESITANLQNLTLNSALSLMLRDLQLTIQLRDEVILVTTPEKAETEAKTVIYNVRDLLALSSSGGDYDALIEVVQSTIDPTTWDDVGGPGSIREFAPRGALVFSQTDRTHRKTAQLFAKLRRQKLVDPPAENRDPQTIVTEVYLVESEELVSYETIEQGDGKKSLRKQIKRRRPEIAPLELRRLITTQIEPGTWNEGRFSIQVIPGRVLIKHRREVQKKIQTLLIKLGLDFPQRRPVRGGGAIGC